MSIQEVILDLAKADTNLKIANTNGILAGPGVQNLTGDKTGLTGYVSQNLYGNVTNMTGVISPLLYGNISNDNGDFYTVGGMIGNITGLIGDITGVKNVNTPWQREEKTLAAQNLVGDITGLNGKLAAITGHASKDLVSTTHINHCWGDVTGLTGYLQEIRGDVSKIYGHIELVQGNVTDLSGNITGCTGSRVIDAGKSYYGSPPYYVKNLDDLPKGPEILVGDVTRLTGNITVVKGLISEDLYGHLENVSGDISNLTGNISGLHGWVTGLWGEIKPKVTGNAYMLAGDVAPIVDGIHFKYTGDEQFLENLTKIPFNVWDDDILQYALGGLPLETRNWYLGLSEARQRSYLNFCNNNYEMRYAKGIHRIDTSVTTGQDVFDKFIVSDNTYINNDDDVLDYILKPESTTDVTSVITMWKALEDHDDEDGTTYNKQYKKKIIIMLSTGDQKKLADLSESKQNKFFENAGPTAAFWALSAAERTSYIENITV